MYFVCTLFLLGKGEGWMKGTSTDFWGSYLSIISALSHDNDDDNDNDNTDDNDDQRANIL